METLKGVLIKEVDGDTKGDKVFIVDNLPKSLIFEKTIKLMVDYTSPQQNMVPEFMMDPQGRKQRTNATVETLLPGIEASQTGDGGFCFFVADNNAKERLKAIDNYIKSVAPVLDRIPKRESISLQPGVMTAGPRPLSSLPRVVLPELLSPSTKVAEASGSTSGTLEAKPKRFRRPMTAQEKVAARERMARAREIRAAQQTGTIK